MGFQKTLFEDVFEQPPVLTVTRQGRSDYLHNQRNECLVERYYFYGKFTNNRYEAILDTLKHEFFIEAETIQDRISENFHIIERLKSEQPPKSYYQKKWPYLVW